jgi:pimeloyl-ACP methyl ester carboxylesterase
MEKVIQQSTYSGTSFIECFTQPLLSSNRNMSTKNLKYLSSEQALADLAYFIEAKKKELKLSNNKWIVFGGSYPGSLAAWFRLKYPHLAHGAVASSAPLFAKINFKGNIDLIKFFKIITAAIQICLLFRIPWRCYQCFANNIAKF